VFVYERELTIHAGTLEAAVLDKNVVYTFAFVHLFS
jgi:hypothetical protein